MTAMADFRCDSCGRTVEIELRVWDEHRPWCSFDTDVCDGRLRRVWSPVSIGRVDGAGGSPARGSSGG